MNSILELNNMKFYAYHGVLPQEHVVGGRYRVSLRLHADVGAAMLSDNLADTVDYAAVCTLVKAEMAVPSALIEHVARRIMERILREFPRVKRVEIRLCKLQPPVSGVEIGEACIVSSLSRDELPSA